VDGLVNVDDDVLAKLMLDNREAWRLAQNIEADSSGTSRSRPIVIQ
jgi:hypothetical protein